MNDMTVTALEREIERELRAALEALLVGPEALACGRERSA